MDKTPPTSPATRRVMGLVFLTVFMDFLGFSIIFPIYPQLLKHYFATEPEGSLLHGLLQAAEGIAGSDHPVAVAALFGGLLGAIFSVLQFIFAPLWGKLSDRIGRRPVLLVTLSGTALAYGLWVFSGSFAVLVASRVLAGMMAGNISVAQAAAADATSGRERSKAMGLIGMAIAAGILVGPALGGIASLHDVTGGVKSAGVFGLNPFSLAAGISLLMATANAVLAWRAFGETLPPERRHQVERRGSIFRLHRLGSPDIRRATVVNLLFFTAFAGMESTLTFVALELFGYGAKQNAWMFTFIALSMALVQGGIVRRMGAKVGEKRLIVAGLLAGFFAFTLVAMTANVAMFYLGLFLFATAAGLTQPSLAALVSLHSDEASQGFHAGVFRSAGALARALGPVAAALLYFKTGGHASVYIAGSVLTLLPLLLALSFKQPRHTHRA